MNENETTLTQTYEFAESWVFPEPVAEWMHNELSSITDPPERPVVHVCSGSSSIGDVRVDKFHENADVRADALQLPFSDSSIPTVVTDPPFKWEPNTRNQFEQELNRVMKPEGLLLWCAPWLPSMGRFERRKIVVAQRRIGLPNNARLLLRARAQEVPSDG